MSILFPEGLNVSLFARRSVGILRRRTVWYCCALLAALAVTTTPAIARDFPATGEVGADFLPLERVVRRHMDLLNATAATVAVSLEGQLVYSRGIGWRDEKRTIPVSPDALFRIASVSKPITAAAVKSLFRTGRLKPEARAFALLARTLGDVKPADDRIWDITIQQLLEHRGGWDRSASFDPMFRMKQIREELQLDRPPQPMDILRFMMRRSLDFAPGEKRAYSNFGYCVLGRVLEHATGQEFFASLKALVFEPAKITGIGPGRSNAKDRDPREVWYPVADDAFSMEVMDANGGLIASAPALCQFLNAYWISGEPRDSGQRQNWTFFGSLPGTTAMVRQRSDGLNVAILFNNRRDASFSEDLNLLGAEVDTALEGVPAVAELPGDSVVRQRD